MLQSKIIEFIDSIYNEFYSAYCDAYNDFKYLLDAYDAQLKDFLESPESLDEPLLTPKELGRFDRQNLEGLQEILAEIIRHLTAYDSNCVPQHAINKLRDDLSNILANSLDEQLNEKIHDKYFHFISEILAARRVLNHFTTCLGLYI